MIDIFAITEMKNLIEEFVAESKNILKDNLVGIYLHGSAVMGCFNAKESDIDLLIVVKEDMSNHVKRSYMDMVIRLNKQAPKKGIELSIVKERVCNPVVYPIPFELHFSIAHLSWYQSDPEDYVERMKGTDKDLAAHFTIIYHRGKALCGKDIRKVFGEVRSEDYLDSICSDIEGAKEDILENPMYMTLNLCRVLAYKEERLILSKEEGGQWGLSRLDKPEYQNLISEALKEYKTGDIMTLDISIAVEFAQFMLEQIFREDLK